MSDEHVSQEPVGGAIAQRPKYEAPAIVDLTSPAKGAAGYCENGSGNAECGQGSAADWDCFVGSGV